MAAFRPFSAAVVEAFWAGGGYAPNAVNPPPYISAIEHQTE